jgi:short-subunit dehydrogenase
VKLAGRTVLLTGATGGLGQAMARALAARGATPILTARSAGRLEPLAAEVGGRAVACDLGDAADLDRLLALVGSPDALIANAALPGSGRIDALSMEEIDAALAVNLRAPIVLAKALSGAMIARNAGHLVFVSSLAGKAASSGGSLYSATKFGLRGFALGLREDLRRHGVGVSVVSPGFIRDAGMFHKSGAKLPPASARGRPSRSPRRSSPPSSETAPRSTWPHSLCGSARPSRTWRHRPLRRCSASSAQTASPTPSPGASARRAPDGRAPQGSARRALDGRHVAAKAGRVAINAIRTVRPAGPRPDWVPSPAATP